MKRLFAIMLCLVLLLGLVGCGSETKESAGTSGESTEKETAEEADGTEEVVLQFWDMPWGGSDYQAEVQALLAEYTELTGVKFEYTNISWDNWLQVFLTAVAAGNAPDLSTGGSLLGHRLALTDTMYDLADFVAEFPEGFFKEGTVDAFYSGDTLVAVPWNVDLRSIYYRKDIFEAEGVEIPTTWDEFYEACKTLTHDDQYGYVTSGSDNKAYWEYMVWSVNNGGYYLNEDMQAEMANEANVEAGEFLRKLYEDGLMPAGVPGYTESDANAVFCSGQAVMIMGGPSLINVIRDAGLEDKVGILPTLTSPRGLTQQAGSYNGIFVYKDSEHIEETLDFIKWYLENNLTLWTKGGMGSMPAVMSHAQDSFFQESPLHAELVEKTLPTTVLQSYPFDAYSLEMDLMDSEQYYKSVLQEVYSTDTDVMEILENADAEYNAALAELMQE